MQNIFQRNPTLSYFHKPKLWQNTGGKIYWNKDMLLKIVKQNPQPDNPILISNEHLILPGIHPTLTCATTNLSYVHDLAEFLVEILTDPKVILIIRRQDAIIASRYNQYIMQGGSVKFDDFLNQLLPNNNPSEYCDYRFYKVIALLAKIIGENHLLVKTVDDIKMNPEMFIQECSEFIGTNIVLYHDTSKKRVNVGFSRLATQIVRALNSFFVIEKENVERKTLTRVPFKIWVYMVVAIWKLDNIIFTNRKRPTIMNAEQKLMICDMFKSDNLHLVDNYDQVKNWL
jgi:hypothetical protein